MKAPGWEPASKASSWAFECADESVYLAPESLALVYSGAAWTALARQRWWEARR
jgi:hypothetical protein